MSRIRILSDHLANQIAAGEVVERPASVVKELVENSLDAEATRLSVQIEGSGTRLIRVVDNGQGMDEDDVLLSIERHATSKLSDESKLDEIGTLGFRGEALPSIGSVSRLTLLSRPQNRETGTRAEIRYGRLHGVHEDGCAVGTIVEVRGLFGNVPARKKFLKSARTEQYHIEEVVRNQSLAHTQTAFSLVVDGRAVLDLQAVEDPEQRVRDVFRYWEEQLLSVDSLPGHTESIHIKGFILPPELASSRMNKLRILVNGRPVQEKMVRHAVVEGLQGFLMKGQSPSGVIYIKLPAPQIDVNVHPAKHEIRFRRSQDIHRYIVQAVKASMRGYQDEVRSEIFTVPSSASSKEHKFSPGVVSDSFSTPEVSGLPDYKKSPVPAGNAAFHKEKSAEPVADFQVRPLSFEPVLNREHDEGVTDFSSLKIVGQLFHLYLLCERDEQLVIIDQHAAHERILYQQLKSAYQEQEIPRQSLMFPVSVEVTPEQSESLEKYGKDIETLGITVEHFGEDTWVVKSVPAIVGYLEPAELLIEALEKLSSGSSRKAAGVSDRVDYLLSSMACKAAVKAGDKLAPEEMLELLVQMQGSEYFSHCPHGRPVIKVFTKREIEKWFHRV